MKDAVPTSLLPTEDNEPAERAPPLKSIMDLYPGKRSSCSETECVISRHTDEQLGRVLSESALSPQLVLVIVSDDASNGAVNNGSLHSEVVAFRGLLGSRERLVVGFRDPFAETVSDRVEVPPATHSTGVKPQFGLLFQLLNLFRAQTADALF